MTIQRIPDYLNGEKVYKEIDKCNATNIDYFKPIMIPYTWQDFADIVEYEKQNMINHDYSSQIAVNLLKGTLSKRKYYYPDIMPYTQEEAFQTFLTYNHLKIRDVIPGWDINKAYFNKYFEKYIHDTLRQLIVDFSGVTDEIKEEKVEGRKTPVKHISKATSFDVNSNYGSDNDSIDTKDSIEYKAMTAPEAPRMMNMNSFRSPEELIMNKLIYESNGLLGLFKTLDEYDNFSISNNLSMLMTLIEKFKKKNIMNNNVVSNELAPNVAYVFKDCILTAEQLKLNKEYNQSKKEKDIEEKEELSKKDSILENIDDLELEDLDNDFIDEKDSDQELFDAIDDIDIDNELDID